MSTKPDSDAPSPDVSDPDKYSVVLENDRVRVFKYSDRPGDTTHWHHHKSSVIHILNDCTRNMTSDDGATVTRKFVAGQTIWYDEQNHIGENVGNTDTSILIVELKGT